MQAPPEKVLAEVRFPSVPELVTEEGEQTLASFLKRYPVRQQIRSGQIPVGSIVQSTTATPILTRTFSDRENSWVVTVSDISVIVETKNYSSKDDFCKRTHEVFAAMASVYKPLVVDNVGLRYIDRVTDDSRLIRLDRHTEPRLSVLCDVTEDNIPAEHSISYSMIRISNNERLRVRSAVLPPSAILDPSVTPTDVKSWVLDLNLFTVKGGILFDPQALEERLGRYSAYIYSAFRWATTDAFLETFGVKYRAPAEEEPRPDGGGQSAD